MCFNVCIKYEKATQKNRTWPLPVIHHQPANSPRRQSKITNTPEISDNELRVLLFKRINEHTEESNKQIQCMNYGSLSNTLTRQSPKLM